MRVVLMLLALLLPAAMVQAQTTSAPSLPRPHPELPSAEQPVRRTPTTGYTLSLIWTPEHCFAATKRGGARDDMECAGVSAHGFILHGLWPDGDGPNRWPQYCHPVAILTDAQLQAGIGATPSTQLLQHEWAKHGSCMTSNPLDYFRTEDGLFAGIRSPDMASLAHRRGLTAGEFQAAFAAANPGMRGDMMRLNLNQRGWLEEVWLCLGLDKRPRTCPAFAGGAQPGDRVKVQAP